MVIGLILVAVAVVQTPDMNGPYIDHVAEDIILVAGGNGYGANCCDEIGRIGAKLATRY